MRWAEVPELAFEVAPNPALATNATAAILAPAQATPARFAALAAKWKEALAATLLLLAAGVAVWWLLPAALRRFREWRMQRSASEAAAFRRIAIAVALSPALRAITSLVNVNPALKCWAIIVRPLRGLLLTGHCA